MDINWYGLSCFRIREGGTTVVCDPFTKIAGTQMAKVKADIVTVSHDQPGHNGVDRVTGDPKVLNGPGEYEIQNVFVSAMATHHRASDNGPAARNVIYFMQFGNMTVGHLGDIGEVPKQSAIDELQLGEVDVLMLPVGGGDTLDPTRAVEMVGLLEPKLLLPMHYQQPGVSAKWVQELEPVERFLKELGVSEAETQSSLRVTKSSLPEETQVVLLEPTQ